LRNVDESNGHNCFTLHCLLRSMADKELQKLRHLAVQQSFWERARDANTAVLLDFHHLKKLTLVVERPESEDSKEVAFATPKPSDERFFEDFDDEYDSGSVSHDSSE
jgi:hypothetical protein